MSTHRMDESQAVVDWPSFLTESKRQFQINWTKELKDKKLEKDFTFVRTIARGIFSKVILAKKESSWYAVKVLNRAHVENSQNFNHVMNERRTLQAANFPFIIHMDLYFADSKCLYFVTPYMAGGDMWYRMRKCNVFSEPVSRFYGSQVVLALEYLHHMEIVYRDLKLENIFINKDGYIILGDLGFCKRIKARTYTMCGTTEYMAPEMLLNQGHAFPVDWWSFGVLIYEMNAGYTPFVCSDEIKLCNKITSCDYTMVIEFSEELQDLIRNLLRADPSKRFGNLKNGVQDIKQHKWFGPLNWLDILNKQVVPPFVPDNADPGIKCPSFCESETVSSVML